MLNLNFKLSIVWKNSYYWTVIYFMKKFILSGSCSDSQDFGGRNYFGWWVGMLLFGGFLGWWLVD